MTDSTDRATVLTALDQARDGFLAAFDPVPDGALAYLPPGDEYALGGLLLHVQEPLIRYAALLDHLSAATGSGPLDFRAEEIASFEHQHAVVLAARPTGAERDALLAAVREAHQQFRDLLIAFSADAFDRALPVLFPGSSDPYATSPRAVAGWVTAHYSEHLPQIAAMLAAWQAQHAG